MKFEPNPEEEAPNTRRHGLTFEPAKQVFDDRNAVMSDNYFVDDEQRAESLA